MRVFNKIFRLLLKDMKLTEPHWELTGKTDFPSLFGALREILPEGSILYFEDGSPSGSLLEFLINNSISEQAHISGGTIGYSVKHYHIPATMNNLDMLIELSKSIAEPELAIHFHVYKDNEFILAWYDAFHAPLILSGILTE